MKKFLLFILLLVLPFQFAWSAASIACPHESGNVRHFGHHYKASTSDDAAGGTQPGKPHHSGDDCPTCGVFALKIVQLATLHPEPESHHHVSATPLLALLSRPPDRPERPNWRIPD